MSSATGSNGSPGRGIALIVGGVIIALLAGFAGGFIATTAKSGSTPGSSQAIAGSVVCDATEVSTTVLPSLVEITAVAGRAGATGSGSIIDAAGHILTNNHVVETAAEPGGKLTVSLARGQFDVPAMIVGRDPLTDVAVIKLAGDAGSLTPIVIGKSADLVLGQPVVALGSPLGLSDTVTSGIVSALDRLITVGGASQTALLVGAIQTDAAINPGNSGGPLVDCSGAQVGINSAGASLSGEGGSIGLNFAIPMDFAMAEAQQLIATGSVSHASLGIVGVSVTAEMAANTGLPRGVLIDRVVPGGPAAKAGLAPYDVITQINGAATPTLSDYLVQVQKIPIGGTAKVKYQRAGQTQTVTCTVVSAEALGVAN
jgi:putative serine protease PepD